ncbi:MAG: ArnT family glycosyltransferase [Limisphaerales bacterium]
MGSMESVIRKFAARPHRSILVLGLALLLVGNWILPITDRDEARFAEASREMLQRGDYIVPWFNGQWRFDKPILIYWCQSACYRVLGVNGFAARLPSVLFTTATALLLVSWGRKAAGDLAGFMAGAMFILAFHVAIIGRIATADMAMVFFFTLAVWSGWELTRPTVGGARTNADGPPARPQEAFDDEKRTGPPLPAPLPHSENFLSPQAVATPVAMSAARAATLPRLDRKVWWLIFYAALAFGFLAKGPVAWLPVGGVVLGKALRKDSFRLPWAETIGGLLLTVALVACWGIPALARTRGQFWAVGIGEHVIHRSIGVNDSHGLKGWGNFVLLLPLYFLTFLVSFLPWTLHKPERLEPWFQSKARKGPLWRAAVALLRPLSFPLNFPIRIWRWWPERRRDTLGWYLLTQSLIVFGVFTLVRTKLPHYTLPAFPCLALWLALQVWTETASRAWFQRRFIAMVILIPVVVLAVAITAKDHSLTENLWRAVKTNVRPETRVGCFGYVEPSLVWKFRGIITNTVVLGDERRAKGFLTNRPPFILVLPTQDAATLSETNALRIQVHGFDMVRFKERDLTAIVEGR